MGLSISVLVALVFVFPGAAFTFGLSRINSPRSPSTLLDQYVSVGLLVALSTSVLLHAVWLCGWQWVTHATTLPSPSVAQFVALLGGKLDSVNGIAGVNSLQAYPARIAFYFLVLTVLAWGLGRVANRAWKSPRKASWYDLLRVPDGVSFIWLTAEVHMDGCCYLFAGPVGEFSLDKNGNLERVVFNGIAAKRLLDVDAGDEGDLGGGWSEVPGERFVLMTQDVRTINLDHFSIEEDTEAADDAQPSELTPD